MSERESDGDLIARARRSDEGAFRLLVERYESTVAGVVVRMLGRGDDADDVGQETFIRFHRALEEFRGDAAVGTYLTRIAMNLSLNALKQRQRNDQREGELTEGAIEALPDRGLDPSQDLEAQETQQKLEAALLTLPEAQRAVVVLRIREGRGTREVAEVLGLPEGTVMSRLKRALTKLKEQLESEDSI